MLFVNAKNALINEMWQPRLLKIESFDSFCLTSRNIKSNNIKFPVKCKKNPSNSFSFLTWYLVWNVIKSCSNRLWDFAIGSCKSVRQLEPFSFASFWTSNIHEIQTGWFLEGSEIQFLKSTIDFGSCGPFAWVFGP